MHCGAARSAEGKARSPQTCLWKRRLSTIVELDCEESVAAKITSPMLVAGAAADSSQQPGDPLSLASDAAAAAAMALRLKDARKIDRKKLLGWLLPALPALALSEAGSRVVQAALEVAIGSDR